MAFHQWIEAKEAAKWMTVHRIDPTAEYPWYQDGKTVSLQTVLSYST